MSFHLRTWIEIDGNALTSNAEQFLRIIPARTRLMAVIKSNAYGHGLSLVAKELAGLRSENVPDLVSLETKSGTKLLWFGVDSIVEALRLRKDGITNPILVLGYTLPGRMADAAGHDIIVSISNFESLSALKGLRERPRFHLKLDTGMCRQGFMPGDMPRLIALLRRFRLKPHGIFTHFASAKDPDDIAYTRMQIKKFQSIVSRFRQSGFRNLVCHASATGGTLFFPEAHFDMVRIGMGLYGYWPSGESRKAEKKLKIGLEPVLTWKSVIAEVKKIPKGSRVGYDGTERVSRDTTTAVIPIGYWHGYDRGLSKIGEMLVGGRRARALGRISMDMTVLDVTDIPKVRVGDEVVLVGTQGKEKILADDLAAKINTTAYEFLTRINPLIKRIVK